MERFSYKTAIPSEVIDEKRIQLAKANNITKLLEQTAEASAVYEGEYILTATHEIKFKKEYGYHEISTTLTIDLLEEEMVEEVDGDLN